MADSKLTLAELSGLSNETACSAILLASMFCDEGIDVIDRFSQLQDKLIVISEAMISKSPDDAQLGSIAYNLVATKALIDEAIALKRQGL